MARLDSMGTAPDLETLLHGMQTAAPTVVAGGDGVHRRVRSVEVVTSPAGWSAAADALIVAGPAAIEAIGADAVRVAQAAGAAGAVIVGLQQLPVELLAAANELAFPVSVDHRVSDPSEVAMAALHALVAHQHDSADAIEDRFAAITLEELMSPDPHRTMEAVERAATLGWDLHRPRAVLLASIDPPVDPAVARRVLAIVSAAARATLGDGAIVWTRATSVAALLVTDERTAPQRRQLADALREELDERVRDVTLSIGVGRSVDGPAQLPTSFVDANRAVDVGRWAKGRHVTELYDELGLERLFASVPQQDLHDFVRNAIGPLLDHDRRHRADLVETLSTWLEARNMAEAARRMFVHYNTFKNRLERIEAILGPVLNDPARLLECEVAIHVSRHYDGPWQDDGAGL